MTDRRRRSELEGLHLLGDLADDTVLALGRVVREEPIQEVDRRVLESTRQLFDLMKSHDVAAVGATIAQTLGDERSYLDALSAVESEARGASIEEFAQKVVGTLDAVLRDQHEAEGLLKEDVARLRHFFAFVSERSLLRTGELTHFNEESSWRSMRQPSLSS